MVDAVVIGLIVVAAVEGYRRGATLGLLAAVVVAGCFAVGWASGAMAGRSAGLFAMLALQLAAFVGFALARKPLRAWLDARLHDVALQVDRALGVVLHLGLLAVMLWFMGIVLAFVPDRGGLAADIRDSAIVSALTTTVTPTSPLGTMVLRSGLIPALDGPVVIAEEPDGAVVEAPRVQAARASVVRVLGEACGNIASGTGWVVADDLIVTNAHVVAGQLLTRVALRPQAPGVPVTVVAIDIHNDLALLRLPNLALAPLPRVADAAHGTPVAVVGFPEKYELSVTAARFDRILEFPQRDIYGGTALPAQLVVFRGNVLAGNSGSPVVTSDGRVVGTVTSSAVEQAVDGGYAAANSALDALLRRAGSQQVDTGACITSHEPRSLG